MMAFFSLSFADDTIVKPNDFVPGNQARAEEVNENFDVVYDQVNNMLSGQTPIKRQVTSITGDHLLLESEQGIILVKDNATITLPDPTSSTGGEYSIINDATDIAVTIQSGEEAITELSSELQSTVLISDGVKWIEITGEYNFSSELDLDKNLDWRYGW